MKYTLYYAAYLAGPDYDSVLVLGCRSHDTIKLHYFIRYSLPFEGDGNWTNNFINTKKVLMIYKFKGRRELRYTYR